MRSSLTGLSEKLRIFWDSKALEGGDPLSSELIYWKSTTKPAPSSSRPIPASNQKSDFEETKIKKSIFCFIDFFVIFGRKFKNSCQDFSDGWNFFKTNLATWQNYVLFAITHSDVELKFTWPIRVQTSSKTVVVVVLWSAFSPSSRTTWVQNLLASKLIWKDENKWNRGPGLPIFK